MAGADLPPPPPPPCESNTKVLKSDGNNTFCCSDEGVALAGGVGGIGPEMIVPPGEPCVGPRKNGSVPKHSTAPFRSVPLPCATNVPRRARPKEQRRGLPRRNRFYPPPTGVTKPFALSNPRNRISGASPSSPGSLMAIRSLRLDVLRAPLACCAGAPFDPPYFCKRQGLSKTAQAPGPCCYIPHIGRGGEPLQSLTVWERLRAKGPGAGSGADAAGADAALGEQRHNTGTLTDHNTFPTVCDEQRVHIPLQNVSDGQGSF